MDALRWATWAAAIVVAVALTVYPVVRLTVAAVTRPLIDRHVWLNLRVLRLRVLDVEPSALVDLGQGLPQLSRLGLLRRDARRAYTDALAEFEAAVDRAEA